MKLEGSCQCGKVTFDLESRHPVPYQRCYCTICRKQQGGGGYAINLGGDAKSLHVRGRNNLTVYHARMTSSGRRAHASTAERVFCKVCGSALWLFSPEWPDLIHPFVSAIDTELPVPPQSTHLMLAFKPSWCEPEIRKGDLTFDEFPEESIEDWHKRHHLER